MATLGGTAFTLLDWSSRVEATNVARISAIVEMLSLTNEVLDDMLVVEGNLPTGHKTTVRTGLPTATWRLLNYGVALSKSTVATVIDTIGNLEAEAQVDRDIAEMNGNTAEFRLQETYPFLQAMSQTMASTLFYGNVSVNPERFTGLAPRYSSVLTSTAQTAANVIDAGGTGSDNTSIWIVTWGAQTTHGITPAGKPTGLRHEDKGQWRVSDPNGLPFWAYVDHYKWELGLSVRDWRYNARICNIDVSDLAGGSAANLINLLVRALRRLPTTMGGQSPVQGNDGGMRGSMGRTVIYMNRTISTYIDLQAMNKTNVWLSQDQFGGKPVTSFRGIPIRTVDAILNTEARVV